MATDTTSAAPVAWRVHPFDYGIGRQGVYAMTMLEQQRDAWLRKGWKVEPLYVAPQAVVEPLTDEAITAAARVLCERQADACGIDRDDQWMVYGDGVKEDARAMLIAAHGIGIKKGEGNGN